MKHEDWTSLTNDDNIHMAYDKFITKLWDIINQHAPERKKKQEKYHQCFVKNDKSGFMCTNFLYYK